MDYVIPKKSYSRDELKNWSLYEQNLSNYPTIKKYLGAIMQKWVENLNNPLAVKWLRQLFESELDSSEISFKNYDKEYPDLLKEILKELKGEINNEREIIKKIDSINGELQAFHYLKNKGYSKIDKENLYIDFKCYRNKGSEGQPDNCIGVSVKTKFDSNEFIISDYIYSLLYLEENKELKNYDFDFESIKGLRDKFINNILDYLYTGLTTLVIDLPLSGNGNHFEPLVEFIPNTNIQLTAEKYYINSEKIEIKFSENNTSSLTLKLNNERESLRIIPKISIGNIPCQYQDVESYIFENINPFIDDNLKKFADDKKKWSSKNSSSYFCGIMNIPVKSDKEYGFLNDIERFPKWLQEKCNGLDYKIIFRFFPFLTFDLKEPKIFEFGPDIQ